MTDEKSDKCGICSKPLRQSEVFLYVDRLDDETVTAIRMCEVCVTVQAEMVAKGEVEE